MLVLETNQGGVARWSLDGVGKEQEGSGWVASIWTGNAREEMDRHFVTKWSSL